MALWCRDLPVVTVARSIVPKPVTLIYPYYENPIFLARQIQHWHEVAYMIDTSRQRFSVIVVDDGSPTSPAQGVIAATEDYLLRGYSLRLFRIEVDIPWNWLAARNIGFHHAGEGWCLVTDIDHLVPEVTLDAVVHGVHDPRIVYAFQRRERGVDPIPPHSASFLMTRALFWTIGGYDETLSGLYGTDGLYRRRLVQHAPIHVLTEYLARHEHQDDSSTTRYRRKQVADGIEKKRRLAALKPGHQPRVRSFPYHEVPMRQEAIAC